MKVLPLVAVAFGGVAVALLGASASPPEMSAPTPTPSASVPGVTSATEPPVIEKAPRSAKGTPVTPKPSKAVPSYSKDQARAGQTLYYQHCAECHGASGEGQYGPGLLVDDGNVQWQPVYYVYSYMQQHMPAGDAHALKKDEYIEIMAFMLKSHGHPAGTKPLTDTSLMNSGALLGSQP